MYEDIEKNPLPFIQNIFRFIGIDDAFVPQNLLEKHNVTGTNRLRIRSINNTIYRIRKNLLKNNWATLISFLKFIRADRLARVILNLNRRDAASTLTKPTKSLFNKETTLWIHNYYKEDRKNLEQFLQRELIEWR
jgi:hypothetical protein